MVGLLMLATLLAYVVPNHAGLIPHRHPADAVHEHALDEQYAGDTGVALAGHEHEQAPCGDFGLLDDGACCSVAHCATMHGGLLAEVEGPFLPRPRASNGVPALATPEGIGLDPALRPPRLIL